MGDRRIRCIAGMAFGALGLAGTEFERGLAGILAGQGMVLAYRKYAAAYSSFGNLFVKEGKCSGVLKGHFCHSSSQSKVV